MLLGYELFGGEPGEELGAVSGEDFPADLVIDELAFSQPKTRDMAAVLKALKIDSLNLLVAIEDQDANVYKSARNIDRVTVSPVSELNALSVLRPRRVLFTKAALDKFRSSASNGSASSAAGKSAAADKKE